MNVYCANPHPSPLPEYRAREQRRGFTLAEVLVTLLFLAIVLPVAMRGVSLSLAAASNSKHVREATSLAEQKLHELTTITMPSGSQSGAFADYPDYRWTCQVASLDYGVRELDLRVTWDDRGQEHGISVSTLFNPNLSAAATGTTDTSSTGTTP